MLESGEVYPIIHSEYPLEEAAAAHDMLDDPACFGKVALLVE